MGTESSSAGYLVPWVWNGAVRTEGFVSTLFMLKGQNRDLTQAKAEGRKKSPEGMERRRPRTTPDRPGEANTSRLEEIMLPGRGREVAMPVLVL